MEFVEALPSIIHGREPLAFADEAAKLRANPMKWARMRAYAGKSGPQRASNTAHSINSGKYRAFPVPGFEAVSRSLQDDPSEATAALFVRYVGE